jgi:hypothetical protein
MTELLKSSLFAEDLLRLANQSGEMEALPSFTLADRNFYPATSQIETSVEVPELSIHCEDRIVNHDLKTPRKAYFESKRCNIS